MNKSKFTEEDLAFPLYQIDTGNSHKNVYSIVQLVHVFQMIFSRIEINID